jgi:L-fuculose-phosphate aldolase
MILAAIMSNLIFETRQQITEIGRMLFDRFLTDAAGGNVSVRVGDVICITPRFSGSKYQWRLRPEQVLVVDLTGKKQEGEGEISREARVHFRLYQEFPDGMAVVHSHPRNVMVFATAGQPIQPVWEGTLKFGVIQVCKFAPAHTADLAEAVATSMIGQESALRKQAIAVIAPAHGLFTLGISLAAAFDATERIEGAAYSILMSKFLPDGPVEINKISQSLISSVDRWGKR